MQRLKGKAAGVQGIYLHRVSDRLPKANVHLLQCLLLVLRHISRSADANKMDARNLAVCISPNLLPVEPLSLDKVEKVTALTQFLIENCGEIFGDGPQTLAVDPAEEDRLADSTDSLSSHGQDSAYNSADPEAEADPAADRPPSPAGDPQEMAAATPSRRSEPAMLRSAGMRKLLSRAQGDEGDRLVQPLAKQASHDSFLLPSRVRLRHLPSAWIPPCSTRPAWTRC
ncbi:hypothetical protein ANANG_G00028850 [Anguilla anguilla]|uniref:Rho-GAP domain-containing protein n=1 Tax=Anguilla anguilla TaxID=7936 RepID=A0A9D3MRA0_ANGAN|nr:hypothetical protein ANANG_G00028850 [Anguilla anguilla]